MSDSPPATIAMMAFEPKGDTAEILVKSFGYSASQFTWEPGLRRGLFAHSGGICGGITTMTRAGPGTLPVTVGGARGSWRIDQSIVERSEDCTQQGVADLPDWSRDGRRIAFFAAPDAIGHRDFDRLDVPYNLYLMDPATWSPSKLLTGIKPLTLRWSPSGEWLAFSGKLGDQDGTYLCELSSKRLIKISEVPYLSIAWSPDGQRLIGIGPLDADTNQNRVVILDASSVVSTS